MTLEVIGAGFGRTGTMSLKVALEELGFEPCYHMSEVFTHPEHVELWRAAAQGEPVEWEQIFGGYRATVDWPACTFYGELMENYPDAKVILTVRDPQRWYESAYNTIYTIDRRVGDERPVILGRLANGSQPRASAASCSKLMPWTSGSACRCTCRHSDPSRRKTQVTRSDQSCSGRPPTWPC